MKLTTPAILLHAISLTTFTTANPTSHIHPSEPPTVTFEFTAALNGRTTVTAPFQQIPEPVLPPGRDYREAWAATLQFGAEGPYQIPRVTCAGGPVDAIRMFCLFMKDPIPGRESVAGFSYPNVASLESVGFEGGFLEGVPGKSRAAYGLFCMAHVGWMEGGENV